MKLDEKHFYTTHDLFHEIMDEAEKNANWPDNFIEYASPYPGQAIPLMNYKFDPQFVITPGSNEGLYLSLGIHGEFGTEAIPSDAPLGTIKTLYADEDSIRKMAVIYGECLIAYNKVLDRRLDDITRLGFDMTPHRTDGKRCVTWTGIKGKDRAISRAKNRLEENPEYDFITIRDNFTRKEMVITRDLQNK